MKQLSFSDMELSINRSKKTRSEIQLDKINQIVNWQDIARLLSETDKTGKQGGRKPISVLVKAKMLFVQYLYNLSDPELEDQLYDRLSFQRFVGLDFSQQIPDFTTLWRFSEGMPSGRIGIGEVCPYECKTLLNWYKNKYKLYFCTIKQSQKL